MFEARVQIAETKISKLTELLEDSEKNYVVLKKELEQSVNESLDLQKMIDNLTTVNGDLTNQAFHANQELARNNEILEKSKIDQDALVDQITQLRCELEEKAKLNTRVTSKKRSEDSDDSQQL